MTKKEMARLIAEEMNLPQIPVLEIVQLVFDAIIETLVTEGRIELPWAYVVIGWLTGRAQLANNALERTRA